MVMVLISCSLLMMKGFRGSPEKFLLTPLKVLHAKTSIPVSTTLSGIAGKPLTARKTPVRVEVITKYGCF